MPARRIFLIDVGDAILCEGETQYGTVTALNDDGTVEAKWGDETFDVDRRAIRDHVVAGTPKPASTTAGPTLTEVKWSVGDFGVDHRGRLYQIKKFNHSRNGNRSVLMIDQTGKTWRGSLRGLQPTPLTFTIDANTPIVGSVVRSTSTVTKYGYPLSTLFVVVAIRNNVCNIVKLGGEVGAKYAYYRMPEHLLTVVDPATLNIQHN